MDERQQREIKVVEMTLLAFLAATVVFPIAMAVAWVTLRSIITL